jgi:hypothetical protein
VLAQCSTNKKQKGEVLTDQEMKAFHKKIAAQTFNQTWDLMDKQDRTQEEIDQMIHAAHASRYHWEIIGEPVNLARGEWQISRVYATLNRPEPCLYHADRCLKITLENDLKDFDLAFAYEAMARAYHIAGDEVETAKYITHAKEAGALIEDQGNQKYFFSELSTILPNKIQG